MTSPLKRTARLSPSPVGEIGRYKFMPIPGCRSTETRRISRASRSVLLLPCIARQATCSSLLEPFCNKKETLEAYAMDQFETPLPHFGQRQRQRCNNGTTVWSRLPDRGVPLGLKREEILGRLNTSSLPVQKVVPGDTQPVTKIGSPAGCHCHFRLPAGQSIACWYVPHKHGI
jgi:hypothetical protein